MPDLLTLSETAFADFQALVLAEADLDVQRTALRKQIGAVLTELRTARGLSFREAGKLLRCDPGLLNRVEKGKAWAYTIVTKALAQYPSIPLVTDIHA
jgi:ribosome-binding protein aMBF1 (putative translation factor)